METTIKFKDEINKQMLVEFKHDGVTHTRYVNAVYTEDGEFDEAANKIRLDEVSSGVKKKIELGVIKNDPEPEEDVKKG